MDVAVLFFLTSGLFLGWSLGANHAANVFGTAVGTRMIRFSTAAITCSVFVVLGAVFSGAGPTQTLGTLGAVNALGGSFMAALSAAVSVYLMTKAGLPVSTTQAIIGSIIGWNLFSGTPTDGDTLAKIVGTWLICPMLAAAFAAGLLVAVTWLLRVANLHLLRRDAYTRLGLLLAGAFGAYSLGANNIANVVGVFVPASPFVDIAIPGFGVFTSAQQLFLIGALAIAVGVITYSKPVMLTIGTRLLPMSPIAAWVVVVAHSLVLFLFASKGLEQLLESYGLPTIPLVPVSSAQAVVGAVIGVALVRGGRSIQWRMLSGIGVGWVITPILSGVMCFIGLFFLQNVFDQTVYRADAYKLSPAVLQRLHQEGLAPGLLDDLQGERFESVVAFRRAINDAAPLTRQEEAVAFRYARLAPLKVMPERLSTASRDSLSDAQLVAVEALRGQTFQHAWQLADALAALEPAWIVPADEDGAAADHLRGLLRRLVRAFRVGDADAGPPGGSGAQNGSG